MGKAQGGLHPVIQLPHSPQKNKITLLPLAEVMISLFMAPIKILLTKKKRDFALTIFFHFMYKSSANNRT